VKTRCYDIVASFGRILRGKAPADRPIQFFSSLLVIKHVKGLLRWFPVGLIYKGPGEQAEGEFAGFDRIHVRRLTFLQPDGSISEPDQGWLPP